MSHCSTVFGRSQFLRRRSPSTPERREVSSFSKASVEQFVCHCKNKQQEMNTTGLIKIKNNFYLNIPKFNTNFFCVCVMVHFLTGSSLARRPQHRCDSSIIVVTTMSNNVIQKKRNTNTLWVSPVTLYFDWLTFVHLYFDWSIFFFHQSESLP